MRRHGKSASATITFGVASAVLSGIGCGGEDVTEPNAGSIEITAATSGPEPDLDGYTVSIDEGTASPLGPNATMRRDGMAPGEHQVRLDGIAADCSIQGTNPRSVTVVAGATATVSFALTCTATTGSLEVTTTTTGDSPDPDGYTVTIDNSAPQAIGISAALTLGSLSAGAHQVTLAGVASNCRVEGDNPRPATVTAGATSTVAFSIVCPGPQGARIAFVSTRDGNEEIYVKNADGTGLARLTTDPGSDVHPAWSPDGTRIAFVSTRDGNEEIYVMNADGSGVTRLTSNAGFDREHAWSPDGSRIAFASNSEGRYDIYLMNADGTGRTRLTNEGEQNFSPTWSPDGTKIAFAQTTEFFFQEIMVMNVDGSASTQLTHTNGYYAGPKWSPNGAWIAFTMKQEGPSFVGVVNSDGSVESFVVVDGVDGFESALDPAWSSDGRLAFSRAPYYEGQADHYPEDFELYIVSPDGSGLVQVTSHSGSDDSSPVWSRDDQKIAFVRSRGGNSDIYVMNPDGTGQTRLTTHPANDYGPAWSP